MKGTGWNPFEEREPPPMSAELFATVVVARLRPLSEVALESRRGLEFKLIVRGEPRTLYLDSYYQRYRTAPETLTPIIDEFLSSAAVRGEPTGTAEVETFESVAERVLPLLVSSAEWERKRAAGLRLVVRPLVQDLGIALAVDEPDTVRYVELGALPQWGVDISSVYDTAIANLEERARDAEVSQIGQGIETLLVDRTHDGYTATRAILESRLADWSARVPGELVLGLPTRDLLLGMSRDHPAFGSIAAQVAQDAAGEHGLLKELLVYRNGVLEILS